MRIQNSLVDRVCDNGMMIALLARFHSLLNGLNCCARVVRVTLAGCWCQRARDRRVIAKRGLFPQQIWIAKVGDRCLLFRQPWSDRHERFSGDLRANASWITHGQSDFHE